MPANKAKLPAIPPDFSPTEEEVRAWRDAIYGPQLDNNNWPSCKENWQRLREAWWLKCTSESPRTLFTLS